MAAAAVLHQPVVYANHIQVGDVTIPIGRLKTSHIYRQDYFGKDVHEVRIWTVGAMGLQGKDVLVDFQLQSAERTNQFFKDILERAGASFSLYATLIRPGLVASGDKVKGVIDIYFQEDHFCEEFDSAIASVFFPGFNKQILDGKTLRLTSSEGEVAQITEIMNKSFAALNAQTHLQTADLLHKNGDPRFYAQRRQEPEACCRTSRDTHYFVALDGTVKKEQPHKGAPPVGHFRTWDERDDFYYAPAQLELPSEEMRAGRKLALTQLLELTTAISKVSDRVAQETAPFIAFWQAELAKDEPSNVVEWEIFRNSMAFGPTLIGLTAEENAAIHKIIEQFEEKQIKAKQEV
jgi:hypothetical protein